jgi:hypothetical protein
MPLFPFVWQYSNQPIDVLAADVAGLVINTDKYVPVSDGVTFQDSTLVDDGVSLETRYTQSPTNILGRGFQLNYATNKYFFGDYDGTNNNTTIVINDTNSEKTLRLITNSGVPGGVSYFGINGVLNSLEVTDSVTAVTAGAAAAKFLKIMVGATPYRIQLLNGEWNNKL